jgi:hypothetical protein
MNNDLISREALEKSMRKSINERYNSWTKTITVADIATLIFDEIDNAPTVDTTCPNCDSGYAQGYSDGYLKGKEERPIDDLSEYSDKLWQKAYERGKAEARPQGEWIPVSERLPEDEIEVLFQYQYGQSMMVGYHKFDTTIYPFGHEDANETGWYDRIDDFICGDDEVIAWMPLPEPYKEAEND